MRAGLGWARGFAPSSPPTRLLPSLLPRDKLQGNMGAFMQITSRVWLSLPFSEWQLQNHTCLGAAAPDCLTPFSSSCRPERAPNLNHIWFTLALLVPIVPLPATVCLWEPQPLPAAVSTAPPPPSAFSKSCTGGPHQPADLPLNPTMNTIGHLTAPKCASWPLLWLTTAGGAQAPGAPPTSLQAQPRPLGLHYPLSGPCHPLGSCLRCQALRWAPPTSPPGKVLGKSTRRRCIYLAGIFLQRRNSKAISRGHGTSPGRGKGGGWGKVQGTN